MKTNRKTQRRGMLSDRVLSAPIAMLLALLLIATAALEGDKVLAQSKRKPKADSEFSGQRTLRHHPGMNFSY